MASERNKNSNAPILKTYPLSELPPAAGREEREKKLGAVPGFPTKIFWDVDVDQEQINRLLLGEIDRVGHIDRVKLYRRLLMTYDWYTLLALIPPEHLREALSASVLDGLYPASLRDRYIYARSVLFG